MPGHLPVRPLESWDSSLTPESVSSLQKEAELSQVVQKPLMKRVSVDQGRARGPTGDAGAQGTHQSRPGAGGGSGCGLEELGLWAPAWQGSAGGHHQETWPGQQAAQKARLDRPLSQPRISSRHHRLNPTGGRWSPGSVLWGWCLFREAEQGRHGGQRGAAEAGGHEGGCSDSQHGTHTAATMV